MKHTHIALLMKCYNEKDAKRPFWVKLLQLFFSSLPFHILLSLFPFLPSLRPSSLPFYSLTFPLSSIPSPSHPSFPPLLFPYSTEHWGLTCAAGIAVARQCLGFLPMMVKFGRRQHESTLATINLAMIGEGALCIQAPNLEG